MTVLLPAPVSPTSATVSPALMCRSTPRSASSRAVEYLKWTPSSSTSPVSRPGNTGSVACGTVVGVSSSSVMRSIATRACWYESNT